MAGAYYMQRILAGILVVVLMLGATSTSAVAYSPSDNECHGQSECDHNEDGNGDNGCNGEGNPHCDGDDEDTDDEDTDDGSGDDGEGDEDTDDGGDGDANGGDDGDGGDGDADETDVSGAVAPVVAGTSGSGSGVGPHLPTTVTARPPHAGTAGLVTSERGLGVLLVVSGLALAVAAHRRYTRP